METNHPGVFGAGDVTNGDQFVDMAAYGAKLAARNAVLPAVPAPMMATSTTRMVLFIRKPWLANLLWQVSAFAVIEDSARPDADAGREERSLAHRGSTSALALVWLMPEFMLQCSNVQTATSRRMMLILL